MSQTPSQRSTKSNSNQTTDGTLQQLTTLVEKLKESLKSLEDKFDNQSKTVESLHHRIEDLTKVNDSLENKITILEGRIDKLSSSLLEEMEDRNSRKRNVIISGLPEEGYNANDRQKADIEHVKKILKYLSVDEAENVIDGISRIGKPSKNGHRLLKVSLRDHDLQQAILRKAKQLRNSDIYRGTFINPDLTPSQRFEKTNLSEELKRRKNAGEDVMIWKGKIVQKSQFQDFH